MRTLNFVTAILVFTIMITGCSPPYLVQNSFITEPRYPFTPEPEHLFVANAYDVRKESYREKKEALFFHLADVAMQTVANRLIRLSNTDVTMVSRHEVSAQYADSVVTKLMKEVPGSHGILIKHLNAEFNQTHVDVTETDDGKDKEAFYDIIVSIEYVWKKPNGSQMDTTIKVTRFHSSRQVISGLFAAGPDIVANSDEVVEGVQVNVDRLLRNFFPTEEFRTRPAFIRKQFESVGLALKSNDVNAALEECRRLTSSPDSETAARAYYNCAVFLERQGVYADAGYCLREALRLQPRMVDALTMIEDY